MEKYEIIVIGAGPVGLYLGSSLGKLFDVLILDSKPENFTYKGFRVMNLDSFSKYGIPQSLIKLEIRRVYLYSPSMKYKITTSERLRGYVVEKSELEKFLLKKAKLNSEVKFNSPVVSTNVDKKEVKTKNGEEYRFNFLIGADGPTSRTRSLVTSEKVMSIKCYSEIYENTEKKRDPSVFFLYETPSFYGWCIPAGDLIEYGIGDQKSPVETFESLKRKTKPSSKIVSKSGGLIPISFVSRVAKHSIFLVGDATGGEPFLGSSLNKGADEANLLVQSLKQYSKTNEKPEKMYQRLWDKKIKPDLEKQRTFRKIFFSSREMLEKSFKELKGKEIEGEGLVNGPLKNLTKILIRLYSNISTDGFS